MSHLALPARQCKGSVRTEMAELGRTALPLVFLQRKPSRGASEPMNGPSCASTEIAERPKKTSLGYR
jgi:hypothetical protein